MSSRHVKQIDSSDDRIIIDAEFQNLSPESLFDYFTVPGLLERWWPSLAEVDPRIAGTYHFSWPKQGWHLRGATLISREVRDSDFPGNGTTSLLTTPMSV